MTSLRRMTEEEYVAWQTTAVPAYAQDKIASGHWSESEALELSQQSFDRLLPDGLQTPGNHVYAVVDASLVTVGMLWIAEIAKAGQRIAFVYDVEIKRDRQREGHAFRAFVELEHEVARLGLSGIALHVFGHNKGAQALYAKLGFQPTDIQMYKGVGAAVR